MVEMVRRDGYSGPVYPVNPTTQEIDGLACYGSLSALPENVEHVAIALANERLEQALDDCIAAGAKAATIFASCRLQDDATPTLAARLAQRARDAGMAICGGNCMGFYHVAAGLRIGVFPGLEMSPGGIAWIAQSGSAFSALTHHDPRLRFSLCVSSGAELTTTVADYMLYALAGPETRVIGLFLETVRDPARFVAALEAAAEREIPVVALKVGRTARSAAMTFTHTGALAGHDGAYRALFRRYGVIQVDDLDEMAATLAVLEQPRRAAAGALATMHDSGGERALLVDLAAVEQVPFAEISAATRAKLAARLDAGLEPENPLDAWGSGRDFEAVYEDCLTALLNDPDTAAAVFLTNSKDDNLYAASCVRAVIAAAGRTTKPVVYGANISLTNDRKIARQLAEAGVPLIKGTRNALRAVKHLLALRDRRRTFSGPSPVAPTEVGEVWRRRLAAGDRMDEAEALSLLSAYGLPTPKVLRAGSQTEAREAAADIGFPVALKTAVAGMTHKSDQEGVVLDLADAEAVAQAYDQLAARLGPDVLVAQMAPAGVEIGLGALSDPTFGPVVMVAAGGTLIEVLNDTAVALAPFGRDQALALLEELRVHRLLSGVRGRAPADLAGLAEAIERFSVLADDLAGLYVQIDVNPVIATSNGVFAVDSLVQLP